MERKNLKIRNIYWIKTGMNDAVQVVLTGFNHNETTGSFSGISRKLKHIHLTKEDAENDDY